MTDGALRRRAGGRAGTVARLLLALRTAGRAAGAATIVLVLAALTWLRPFAADRVAVAAAASSASVTVVETATTWELRPTGAPSGTGLAFHPGARVDPRAHLAPLRPLAEQGHLEVVATAPLGGTAAALGATGDPRVRGLLLWASYPAGDLSGSDLAVASVSGDRDGLTTPADVERTRALLPPSSTFTVVPGAVHAFFGDYGPQPGDGEPTVERAVAQARVVEATAAFVRGTG